MIDVFVSGDGLYHTYRIPSLIKTRAGTLLAFAEGRASTNDHAENDIVMRRSTDDGLSWSEVRVLRDDGTDSLNDPLVVQVRQGPHQDRILLTFERFPAGCHANCVVPGYEGDKVERVYLMFSDDDGLSWSEPIEISRQVKRETAHLAAGGPGIGIQKLLPPRVNRIVMPFRQQHPSRVYAVFSDDGGDTWGMGSLADDSQTRGGANEVQMVELADGALLLNARSYDGTKHRKVAKSVDGGDSWTPLEDDDELIEPVVMASTYRFSGISDGDPGRILFAGPNSRAFRINGAVWLSYDEGESWSVSRTIWPFVYGYSILTRLDCNNAALLFERGINSRYLSLFRFSIAWLTNGADPGSCR